VGSGKSDRWRDRALIIGVTLAVLVVFGIAEWRQTGGQPGAPLDDVYIHFQFARNLATGHGLAFNPDQPTSGSTSPLWAWLLAGGYRLFGALLIPARVLSGLAFLFVALAAYALAWRLIEDRRAALLAGLLTALSGRLAWAGSSGMETTLFTLLSLLGILRHDTEQRGGHPAWGSSALFGLASLLRPEGYLLFGFATLDRWLSLWLRRHRSTAWSRRLALEISTITLYLAFIAPYLVFSFTTTGHWLPNTFRAVSGNIGYSPWRYGREYLAFVGRDHPLLAGLLPLGLAALLIRRRGPWTLVFLWWLGLPLIGAWIAPRLRHHGRYVMPLIPLTVLLGVAGLLALHGWWQKRRGDSGSARRILTALAVVVALPLALWWADQFAWNVDNINDMQVSLGHWVAGNTPPDAVLALNDIGAIGYLSQRQVVDVVGLVSPEAIDALQGRAAGRELDMALCRFLSYTSGDGHLTGADYAILLPDWYPELTRNRQVLTPIHAVRLARNTIAGGEEMIVYRPDWPYVTDAVIDHPQEVELGGWVRLRGFDLSPIGEIAPGENLRLTLYWESLAATETDYKVFVHLADDAERIWGQHDGHPVDGLAATSFWQPGDVVRDQVVLAVAPDAPPGEYQLLTGLYDEATMTRLPVTRGPDAGSGRVWLMHVRVGQ